MDTQWTDAVKQKWRVRDAAAKNTTKISSPVPQSDAATAKQTTKYSQGTANTQKKNINLLDPNKRTYTQTTGHTKISRTESKSWINLLKRSEENL